MAVTILGGGGLATRLGSIAGRFNDLSSLQGGTATVNVTNTARLTNGYNALEVLFANTPVFTSLLDGFYNSFVVAGQNSIQSIKTQLNSVANSILQQQVNADTPLSQVNTPNALAVLMSQLFNTYYVVTSGAAAGAQTAIGSPVGTPTILVSMIRGDGLSLEYVLPETLTITCTADQNSSGVSVNNETFSVIGQAPAQSALAYNWPLGSGVNTSIQNVDATQSNANGNLLTNSDFQLVTNANVPDNWIILTGTRGVSVAASNTAGYTNGYLEFLGQASAENTSVYQAFNTAPSTTLGAGGTPATLAERNVLAFNGEIKMSATPAQGVLAVSLTDGNNVVLNNDAGVAQTITFPLTGVSTSYVNINGFLQVPTNFPTSYRVQVHITTPLPSGKNLFMGHFALALAQQLYAPVGPFIASFASNTPPILGDGWTIVVSTNMGAGSWQGVFSRLFQVQNAFGNYSGISLRVPTVSSGGETVINANLIA